jgi:antitoxin (DNA-binding transcriptional repressor) of toxin-antitoxin stability system
LAPTVDALKAGDSVRLVVDGRPIAVVSPLPDDQLPLKPAKQPFAEWQANLPADFEGLSKEEVDPWRDRSPGRDINF